jgi:hypothetical protein
MHPQLLTVSPFFSYSLLHKQLLTMKTTILLTTLIPLILATPSPRSALPAGKKIQWVGHSFHWFLPEPVAKLATEAGIQGHKNIGVDRIGASLPCQHWNKQSAKDPTTNDVKEVLKAGTADVLTLATREPAPDECIPKFVQLAASKRLDMKVMVHETWLPQSAKMAVEECEAWGCKNRDAADSALLALTRQEREIPFKNRLRKQLVDLNKELGANITTIVPVWDAVIGLRELIVEGKLPGVSKQSALFKDNLGHAQKPLADMASYMWFGALYNINPQGMKSLDGAAPQGYTPILQKLAWDTLRKEPLNGLL